MHILCYQRSSLLLDVIVRSITSGELKLVHFEKIKIPKIYILIYSSSNFIILIYIVIIDMRGDLADYMLNTKGYSKKQRTTRKHAAELRQIEASTRCYGLQEFFPQHIFTSVTW